MGDIIDEAVKWAQEVGLFPVVSLYIDKALARKIVQKAKPVKDVEFKEFPYYAYPEGRVVLNFVSNNWVPPKAFLLDGSLRLAFAIHSYDSLMKEVSEKEEDDVVVTAKDGKVSVEKRRVFYMDFRSVSMIDDKTAFKVLGHTGLSTLKLAIIANNVVPGRNRVAVEVKGDNVNFEILEGRLKAEEVESGAFLTESALEDLRKSLKAIREDDLRNALLTKVSV